MIDEKFGNAGNQVVIEEYLDGVEASILSFTDSKVILPLLSAKDHKKIGENETGAAGALDFIGGDLFPIAGAAQHDPERPGVVDHPLGGRDTKCWVIVVGVIDVGATVDYFVSSRQQVVLDSVFEFKACTAKIGRASCRERV